MGSQEAPRQLPGGSGAHRVLPGCPQSAPKVLPWRSPCTCKTFKNHWFLQCFRGVASQVVSFGSLGSPRAVPGCSQGGLRVVSGWSQAVPRKLPGRSKVTPRRLGSSQGAPRVLSGCLKALPGCCQCAPRALPGCSQDARIVTGCSQDAPRWLPGCSQGAQRAFTHRKLA